MSDEPPVPLSQCVDNALKHYFVALRGEEPANLYSLVLNEVERPLLQAAMQYAQSNQCRAARYLGINRNTLRKKLKAHGLD
ncbi:MAG: Fis family transcriptional regulator [Parasphingorhabdus sp.]|jgi:Fis family transcriptional regulator